jgi:hypothetical protein
MRRGRLSEATMEKSLDRNTTGRPTLTVLRRTYVMLALHFAQPHKLIYALMWFHVTFTFKIVGSRNERLYAP